MEKEGRREERFSPPIRVDTEMPGFHTSFSSLPLGDRCTLLLQVVAHAINIWLWEEAGLIWWEEERQRGHYVVE